MILTFTINDELRQVETDARTSLLEIIREDLNLRGTKYGCGEGECGACTVLLNGRTVNACLTTAGQAHGSQIYTIEAMAADETGRILIDSFIQAGAVQCGFCTPGFVLSARGLLAQTSTPDDEQIRRALGGNLCRCTGYAKIVEAVKQAADLDGRAPAQAGRQTLPLQVNAERTYARPATLAEALQLLAEADGRWRVLAGGTDLLVAYEHHIKDLHLLDLGALNELGEIYESEDGIHIGALATYTDILQSALVQKWAPALAVAASEVGGVQIQNMGTIGGNLANGSPAADSAPPLYALDAWVLIRSLRGERRLPLKELTSSPGRTRLARDEIITQVVAPKLRHAGQRVMLFEKIGPRKAQTIAKASLAMSGWLVDGQWQQVRIALGAVAPTVILATEAAEVLMSRRFDSDVLARAAETASSECSPITDIRSTADYRRMLVRGLFLRNLHRYLPYSERNEQARLRPEVS